MDSMTISIGREADAPSVEVALHTPTTFDDPQWAAWGMDEADICAAAVRTVRVDIANGGARKELRKVVKAHPKDESKWLAPVQAYVDGWKRGRQKTSTKIMDARGMGFTAKQVAHFEKQGYKVLTD